MVVVCSVLFKKLLTFVISVLLILSFSTKVNAATFEEEVVRLTNIERNKQGLSSLNYSDKLFQASSKHNNMMFDCSKIYGVNACFKHQVTQLSEESLLPRIQKTNYNPQSVAENIAWGYQTPQSVVSGWMGSSGHRANILGNYKDIGCDYLDALNGSYQGKYWTCDFGRSFSQSTNPSPTRSVSLTPTRTPTPTTRQITPTPTRIPSPTRIITSQPSTPTPTSTQSSPSPTIDIEDPFAPLPNGKPWYCKYFEDFKICE